MFGSRAKGCRGEREVAHALQEWWKVLEPGAEFCRTPSSGGWQTPTLRAGFHMSGDLCTTAKRFPFTVEIKHREQWDLLRFNKGKASPVWKWWLQAQTQAEESRTVPMLWFRKNRQPWRVLLPERYISVPIVGGRRALLMDRAWPSSDLVDGVGLHPICYLAETLLAKHPKYFVALEIP